jgi:beta-lactamase superfamily II metal-dependent hydrolase
MKQIFSLLFAVTVGGTIANIATLVFAQTTGGGATQSVADVDTLWRAIDAPPIPLRRPVVGDRTEKGPFRYYFKAPAGASLSAHRHSVEMRIAVRSGRKFILMGDLETARVQRFEAGSSLVIPADTWHVEWWETETLEEIQGIGPMLTEQATPSTPRV